MVNCNVDLWAPLREGNISYDEWMHKQQIKSAEILSKWSKEQSERTTKAMKPITTAISNIKINSECFKFQPDIKIKNVIFRPPATIVFWNDGTKTVSKTHHGDEYDAEKGLAMAVMRKILNNKDYHKYLTEAEEFQTNLD